MAALVSASLCSSQGDADRFDSGVLGTHLLRGYLCGLTPCRSAVAGGPSSESAETGAADASLGGEPLFSEDAPSGRDDGCEDKQRPRTPSTMI